MPTKKRKKRKKPPTVTIHMNATILAIDANFDPITQAPFDYREENIYPLFQERGVTIVRGFANGLIAEQVFQNVQARFQEHIDRLKSTGDSGDLFNASVLEVDMRLLRAPSVAPEYGDPNAKLIQ